MICSKCNNAGVKNTVLGKEFYYCRTCKDEIGLAPKSQDFGLNNKYDGMSIPILYGFTASLAPSAALTRLGPLDPGSYDITRNAFTGVWEAIPTNPYSFGWTTVVLKKRGYLEIDQAGKVTMIDATTNGVNP